MSLPRGRQPRLTPKLEVGGRPRIRPPSPDENEKTAARTEKEQREAAELLLKHPDYYALHERYERGKSSAASAPARAKKSVSFDEKPAKNAYAYEGPKANVMFQVLYARASKKPLSDEQNPCASRKEYPVYRARGHECSPEEMRDDELVAYAIGIVENALDNIADERLERDVAFMRSTLAYAQKLTNVPELQEHIRELTKRVRALEHTQNDARENKLKMHSEIAQLWNRATQLLDNPECSDDDRERAIRALKECIDLGDMHTPEGIKRAKARRRAILKGFVTADAEPIERACAARLRALARDRDPRNLPARRALSQAGRNEKNAHARRAIVRQRDEDDAERQARSAASRAGRDALHAQVRRQRERFAAEELVEVHKRTDAARTLANAARDARAAQTLKHLKRDDAAAAAQTLARLKEDQPPPLAHLEVYGAGLASVNGFWGVDPEANSRWEGRPVYKKLQRDGTFCSPGKVDVAGCPQLWYNLGEQGEGYWIFTHMDTSAAPNPYVHYTPGKRPRLPPLDGWVPNQASGTLPAPRIRWVHRAP